MQLGDELKKQGRENLVCKSEFAVELTTQESFALKSSLALEETADHETMSNNCMNTFEYRYISNTWLVQSTWSHHP